MLLDSIKAAQAQRGWSDGRFAKELGISQSVLSRIKSGKRPLDNVRFLRAVGRVIPELKMAIANYILE